MAIQVNTPNTYTSIIVKCMWVSAFTFAAIGDKSAHFCHYSCASDAVFT